jgi:NADH dehydrogenase [ubiquinone] 1 alpha subcomplex assembly factor 7
MNFRDALIAQTKQHKTISVAEYMRACVQEYYATATPFGAAGDFITAPEISQIFGEIIGAWVAQAWLDAGSPQASIVELGGGRGTLMKDALRATKGVPQFHASTNVIMVESSPALAQMQMDALTAAHPRVSKQTAIEPLPNQPVFFIANEFFDALPIEQTIDGVPRMIMWDEDFGFRFQDSGQGEIREYCPAAEAIMHTICAHIKARGGALIAADYGYAKAVSGDTLQAVKNHRFVGAFESAGEADLTAHVNFEALMQIATTHGLQARLQTQGGFLQENGAELRAEALCRHADKPQQNNIIQGLERLMQPDKMGELFKVLAVWA